MTFSFSYAAGVLFLSKIMGSDFYEIFVCSFGFLFVCFCQIYVKLEILLKRLLIVLFSF